MLIPTYIIYLVLSFVFSTNRALATSCQVYPSEYAYRDDTVTKAESASANCRRYPAGNLPGGGHPEDYTHCDGIQLKLADSNVGQEQYQSTNYYQWPAGSASQLLFIFPTKVSLTTITLHYYSDSVRGRPRLRFYAVPDDFDVWDAITTEQYLGIGSVPPGGESAGRRNTRLIANFNITKLLMYKYSSSFAFAVSEVEFSTMSCGEPIDTDPILATIVTEFSSETDNNLATGECTSSYFPVTNSTSISLRAITSSALDSMTLVVQSNGNIVAIGVSISILLILSTILIITATVLIWSYKRRSSKQVNNSSPYSTLNRRAGQPQALQQDCAQLYDQIHLSMSPSTGQAEYIPKSETGNINNPSQTSQNSHPTCLIAGRDTAEHSSTLNTAKATTSQLSSQRAHESTSKQSTYAAVDTSKKKKVKVKEDAKCKAAEKGPPVAPYTGHEVPSTAIRDVKENITKHSPHTIEQLYAAVKMKPEIGEPKGEEETPLHTVEELYTAVQKKPKSRSNTDSNEDKAPPAHTVMEEIQTAGEKPSQSVTEDLYTAIMKSPKDSSDYTQTAPPIPPHTLEELYTAVTKKPNSDAEDEEEAPPIPPYTATL